MSLCKAALIKQVVSNETDCYVNGIWVNICPRAVQNILVSVSVAWSYTNFDVSVSH